MIQNSYIKRGFRGFECVEQLVTRDYSLFAVVVMSSHHIINILGIVHLPAMLQIYYFPVTDPKYREIRADDLALDHDRTFVFVWYVVDIQVVSNDLLRFGADTLTFHSYINRHIITYRALFVWT